VTVKYRNNLTDESSNAYFRVVAPFDCYALVGLSDSNTYAGRSMVCGNVYRKLSLQIGDEIHDLFGGVFVVAKGSIALPGRMQLPTKHPFERGPDAEGAWPLDKLQRLALGRNAEYASKPAKMSPGALCANGIDSVVP
jgi:hypothetical protein